MAYRDEKMRIPKHEAVVLLHGLGLHSCFMRHVGRYLNDNGYDVYNLDYPSRQHNIETATAQIHDQLQDKDIGVYKRVHLIGHSLGGILARNLLYRYWFHNQGKVIALAPPNNGSLLVDRLKRFIPVSWYLGPAFLELGSESHFLENFQYIPNDYYVIAGNRSRWTLFGFCFNDANDGVVTVKSTIAEGMERTHHNVYPVTHFSMLHDKKVFNDILEILK